MYILLCPDFVPWPVDKIFGARQLSELKKELEPIRPIHDPWVGVHETSDLNWQPVGREKYTSAEGGGT